MLEHTPKHSIAYPARNSLIKDPNVTAKLADDIRSTAFSAEQAIDAVQWNKADQQLLSTTSLDDLPPAAYTPISAQAAEGMGLPTRHNGALQVFEVALEGRVVFWFPVSSSYSGFWVNRRVGSSNWTGWEEYTPTTAHSGGGVEREMRVAQASSRRGGTYGTNGTAVLSLVFDHGTNNFMSKIVPILSRYNVPATLGLNSRMYDPSYQFHHSDDETSWEQIQDAAIEHGFTIWNHGRWHTGGGFDEIVGGREDLEAALPEIPIDGWLHTGTYGDFQSGSTFAKYWEHEVGAIIMNSHAYLTGDIQEPVKPLTGQLKPGFDGQWVDSGANAIATVKSMVEDAQQVAGGVMLRHHPMYLDETGYLSSQELEDFIAWAAAERDAGRLLILTADLMNHADAGRSYRRNLLPGDGGSGNQARTVSVSRNALAKGSVNELHATVRLSSAGGVRLTATTTNGLSKAQTFSVPANSWQDIRSFFTIPLNATGELVVTVERVSGSGLQVHQMNVYPG